jgi:hypothetical protein
MDVDVDVGVVWVWMETVERTNSGDGGRVERWDFRVGCQGEGGMVDIFLIV